MIFAFQVVAAVLLPANHYVRLAVAVPAPVIVNIFVFHALMAPSGLRLARAVFPDQKPIDRTFIDSREDRRAVEAVKEHRAQALGPGTKLQMIAVDDIGWFGARAFAAALNRREIDLAGDVRTMPEAAEILTEALGRPIAFAQTPIEQVRQYSRDMALMLQWFERVGYSADIAGLEREFARAPGAHWADSRRAGRSLSGIWSTRVCSSWRFASAMAPPP